MPIEELARVEELGIYPPFHVVSDGVNEPECVIDGRRYVQFCANNYLGLTHHAAVKAAARDSIDRYGVGPGGSRVISGNIDVTVALESALSELSETEDCLTFPTGYMANVGAIPALLNASLGGVNGHAPVVYSDQFNHGSIVDGCRLANTKRVTFRHNDLDDLESKLVRYPGSPRLIVTEGVFSLEGEILDLAPFVALARKHGAMLMLDDAHGVGILGHAGGGTPQHHRLTDGVDVLMGCMDKAFGGTGGYVCGRARLIKYLRVACRSSLLSSAMPTAASAAMLAATRLIRDGVEVRRELFAKSAHLREQLTGMGFTVLGPDTLPAIPLYVGDEAAGIRVEQTLFEYGVYLPIVRWPAVPAGGARFRIIVTAAHEPRHIDTLLEGLRQCSGILTRVAHD